MEFLSVMLAGVLSFGTVLCLYFLPWIIAARRLHHQRNSIAVLNTFLGWTLVGWVAALVWSVSAIREA